MDRGVTSSQSLLRTRAAAVGLGVVFALFVWFVAVMSAAIDFAVAAAVALGWCIWLERSASRAEAKMASGDQPSRKTPQLPAVMSLAIAVLVPAPANAQTSPPDPNPGNLTLSGSFDVVSMFKLGVDDSPYLGKAALKPYAVFVFEFDTEPGVGQADGGSKAGRYLELGVAPGYWPRASVSVPVKLGLSLSNYYELNTGTAEVPAYVDNTFGYFSVAGIVTAPLGGTTSYGAWNLHGGIEVQALGDTTKAFNGGDESRVIGSIGIGFSY